MDLKVIVWIYLPIVVGLLGTAYSINLSRLKPIFWNLRFSLAVVVLNAFSIYILIEFLNDGWPTYVPHILIGLSTLIVAGQWLLDRN